MASPSDAPAQIVHELRADMLGTWLPIALADLACASAGAKLDRSSILRSWGLETLARQLDDAATDDAIKAFERFGQ